MKFIIVILMLYISVFATLFKVNTLDDISDGSCNDGSCSLRDAMLLCADMDTIYIEVNGTIELSEHLPDINSTSLTIYANGSDKLVIDANNSCRPFKIYQGNLTLSHLKIIDGNNTNEPDRSYYSFADSEDSGGAIYLSRSGSLQLTGVDFSNNVAKVHGGAIMSNGTLSINDCNFYNNKASGSGGALRHSGDLEISSSSFTFNESIREGGAVIIYGSSSISETKFTLNKGWRGGGLSIGYANPNTHTIVDSEFSVNINAGSETRGGAIYTMSALSIKRSLLVANSSQFGGAIYSYVRNPVENRSVNIINSTISDNSAIVSGSAIYIYNTLDCDVKISHTTIVNNISDSATGAGINQADECNVYLKNTILSNNKNSERNYDCTTSFKVNFFSQGHNILSYSNPDSAANCTLISSDINTTQKQVADILLDNGGKTKTYALLQDVQANNSATCSDNDGVSVSEDQRGFKRGTRVCDVGAYEDAEFGFELPAMFYLLF